MTAAKMAKIWETKRLVIFVNAAFVADRVLQQGWMNFPSARPTMQILGYIEQASWSLHDISPHIHRRLYEIY